MLKNFLIISFLAVAGCTTPETTPAHMAVTPRDTTITRENAFTLLKIDSLVVQHYLDSSLITDTARLLIKNFYNSRNYQYAWFNENGITEHAMMLWNLYNDHAGYSISSASADSTLAKHMEEWQTDTLLHVSPAAAKDAELKLTRLFFDYAFAKYLGSLNPAELQWYIPRRKIDVSALLDSLITREPAGDGDWEPLHPQYRLMKNKMLALSMIADEGGWDSLPPLTKKIQVGDSDSLITKLKRRLALTGQFMKSDSSPLFSKALKDSLIAVQRQFGLQPTGILNTATIKALNVPVEKRVQQILINMERIRWLPQQPTGTWILANIPSFRLQVFENDSSKLQMNIVVGAAATRTVIFSDDLKYIVFSPYWNVPPNIVRNEILPALKKNPNYLKRSSMEQTGTSNGLPVVRQLPGPGNALGEVKFLFPNSYNIYLHDTPARSFFKETSRAFSHGCVRLGEPFELAKFLLRSDSSWTDNTIRAAMNAKKEKWVTLKKPVPVFITYFTSWVDDSGQMQFREDIYGHDARMATHLFK